MRTDCATAARDSIPSDAQLVYRIAALSDRLALAELYQRHGLTLYALAYSIVLDGDAADSAVAHAFREIWHRAASFDDRLGSVARWLAHLTRRAAEQGLALSSVPRRAAGPASTPSVVPALAPPAKGHAPESRRSRRWRELVRVAASAVLPALLLE